MMVTFQRPRDHWPIDDEWQFIKAFAYVLSQLHHECGSTFNAAMDQLFEDMPCILSEWAGFHDLSLEEARGFTHPKRIGRRLGMNPERLETFACGAMDVMRYQERAKEACLLRRKFNSMEEIKEYIRDVPPLNAPRKFYTYKAWHIPSNREIFKVGITGLTPERRRNATDHEEKDIECQEGDAPLCVVIKDFPSAKKCEDEIKLVLRVKAQLVKGNEYFAGDKTIIYHEILKVLEANGVPISGENFHFDGGKWYADFRPLARPVRVQVSGGSADTATVVPIRPVNLRRP